MTTASTTTGATTAVQSIATVLRATTGYGEMLLEDIPADKFAHMPHPTMNHPAFCIGHLSLYADRILQLIGKGDLTSPRDGFAELFSAGVECINDPAKYPAKNEIVAYYRERHAVAADALEQVTDDVLAGEHPAEGRFKEMLPTVGCAVNFMATAHHMMHLGQVSAWRRAVGLPSVM